MTPYHDRVSKDSLRDGARRTHVSLVQHHEPSVPHSKVLPSLAQVVEPDQHTLSGSQQKVRPVVGSREQADGGWHLKGEPGQL